MYKFGTKVFAFLSMLIGMGVAWEGTRLGLWEGSAIGPGFLPLVVGVLLVPLGIIVCMEVASAEDQKVLDREKLQHLTVITVLCVTMTGVSKYIGYLPALAILAGCIGRYSGATWKQTITTVISVGLLFYLLFVKLLMTNFPVGSLFGEL